MGISAEACVGRRRRCGSASSSSGAEVDRERMAATSRARRLRQSRRSCARPDRLGKPGAELVSPREAASRRRDAPRAPGRHASRPSDRRRPRRALTRHGRTPRSRSRPRPGGRRRGRAERLAADGARSCRSPRPMPRVRLANLPTPLERAPRRRALGWRCSSSARPDGPRRAQQGADPRALLGEGLAAAPASSHAAGRNEHAALTALAAARSGSAIWRYGPSARSPTRATRRCPRSPGAGPGPANPTGTRVDQALRASRRAAGSGRVRKSSRAAERPRSVQRTAGKPELALVDVPVSRCARRRRRVVRHEGRYSAGAWRRRALSRRRRDGQPAARQCVRRGGRSPRNGWSSRLDSPDPDTQVSPWIGTVRPSVGGGRRAADARGAPRACARPCHRQGDGGARRAGRGGSWSSGLLATGRRDPVAGEMLAAEGLCAREPASRVQRRRRGDSVRNVHIQGVRPLGLPGAPRPRRAPARWDA